MRKIIFFVLSLHALLLMFCLTSPSFSYKPSKKPLVVKTIEKPPHISAETKMASSPQKPLKKAAPLSKKQVPPAAEKKKKQPAVAAPEKKSTPKKSPPLPESKPKIPQNLLQELEETIAKIDEKRDKLYLKRESEPLHIDEGEEFVSVKEYQKTLSEYLHRALYLPEYGEVKIQLTLDKEGHVIDLIVLKAESEKNKHYLEEQLPLLTFPSLERSLSRKSKATFTLTFCNEI